MTNVVNKKPPHDEWKLHATSDVRDGLSALHNLCRREEPALIVAFGEHALHALIADDPDASLYKITEARGYVFPSPYGPVLAATHPAFILRNWHPWWALFTWDLRKAKRIHGEAVNGGWKGGASKARQFYTEEVTTHVPPLESVSQTVPTAIDIETDGELGIACIGWSWDRTLGWCAPYRVDFFPWFHTLLGSAALKVFQNGQFDVTVLERHGFPVRNWQHDTMLLWHTLEPLLAGKVTLGEGDAGAKQTHKGLRFLASVLTDEPFWKDYNFQTERDRYILCARDSRVTLECFERMRERLP